MNIKIRTFVVAWALAGGLSLEANAQALYPVSDVPGAPLAPGASSPSSNNLVSPRAITVSTGFDGTEPTIPGDVRIFRDGVPSTCAGKVFPGTFPSANTLYDAFTYYNNGPETCVTVNFDTGTCGVEAHATAYIGSFNPNDLGENYAGDVGASVTQPFSFIAPANSPVVIVITSNFGSVVCDYSFSSQELDEFQVSPAPVPTLSQWALISLAMLLTVMGYFAFRRRI